mgnify:FL=1
MKGHSYFSADIKEFLFLLGKHRVRYLIVGGEAVIYYGHARLTGDVDLFYETTENNAQRLFEALNEFWDRDIPGLHAYEELMQQGMIFQFGVPPNRIDLISVLEAVEFVEAWKRKKVDALSYRKKKFPIYYVGLDDLIRNKKAVGRDRDKDDLKFLTQLRRRKR